MSAKRGNLRGNSHDMLQPAQTSASKQVPTMFRIHCHRKSALAEQSREVSVTSQSVMIIRAPVFSRSPQEFLTSMSLKSVPFIVIFKA
jgi:hypothetical protein